VQILIIGGTRFIGPRVVRHLSAAGHEVTLFNRGQSLSAQSGDETRPAASELIAGAAQIHGDRRALDANVIARLQQAAPEVVIDMCCLNEADARGMLDVFQGIARRYVLVSSCDVYRAYGILHGSETGAPALEPTPLKEDSPLRTELYPYRGDKPRAEGDPLKHLDDYDKIPAEELVLGTDGIEGTVLRLPMVYGPGDYQHRLRDYVARMTPAAAELRLAASLAGWRTCRGFVGNVAAAIALAAAQPAAAGRAYNVAEQPAYSELEWARLIARALDWPGHVAVVSDDELPEDERPRFNSAQHLDVDSTRLRKELGYVEPVGLTNALWQSVDWERALQKRAEAQDNDAAGGSA